MQQEGPLFIAVRGPLVVVASLVGEHGLQERVLRSCVAQVWWLRGMWNLPGLGIKPVSPALVGRFLTTLGVLRLRFKKYSRQKSGEGDGTPLQCSCLENPMGGGAWWAAVCGVEKSQTRLSDFTFTFHFHALEKEMATHSSVLAWRIPGTGAWWAAVSEVAQSWTRLKQLSSSSRQTPWKRP